MNDSLIKPIDVIKHYEAIERHHPGKNLIDLKVFEGFSHIDFTYVSHHILV